MRPKSGIFEDFGEQPIDSDQRFVFPVRAVDVLQLHQQGDIARSQRQTLQIDAHRLVAAPQSPFQHLGFLKEKTGAMPVVIGGGNFRVQQLHHHLPVADALEQPPRGANVAQKFRRQPVRVLIGDRRVPRIIQWIFPEPTRLVEKQR